MTTDHEPTIVQVNLGLKARHFIMLGTVIAGLLGTGGITGWLFLPAKATDLTALTAVVETVRVEQARTAQLVASLTSQTEQLSDAVDGLRVAVEALPRRRADIAADKPRKAAAVQRKRPAAKVAEQGKGLFGGL